ncbi:DNA-3-methyladenine glycosylase 2 family protein [Curtobacterium flaccumfaciens pv. flaccumfaciens]|uniref:DNA-3-methyladenine glycosylase family protein n=1 Tax=Curtobacterium flaccumfaciens TaxID=2035 RepID=UPI00217D3E6D|nr:DNA-3-methyladenine glycosylase 2 family protein [Curtobacterium flaccumfaciens]MCS6568183.1 DNA-3-methyladenine glycosylase 2 family protein [Curtobacterium flaccumfaciens pv. flaccumfaciens]MCS6584285.1 DNA-3-methyladenine glycosylase 2 family protein [Curtobacterium flaccumfaciens pv. flaccumfaciens]
MSLLASAAVDAAGASGDASRVDTVYRPGGAVDVASTLRPLQRGSGDPAFQVVGGVVWLALRTPSGPASVAIRRAGDTIAVSAWGSGASWAVFHAPEMLGRGDDWDGFDVTRHEFLAAARHKQPGLRLLRTNTVVAMLVPAIMEQKVTSRQAWGAWRYLLRRHGTPAPGPAPAGMMVPPDARTWARIPSWEWHRAGIEPGRSATVMRAVKLAPALERTLAHGRGGEVVSTKLQSIPGVGRWTAAETAQRSHGDPDSPSVGDFHVPALVGWALTGAPVDDDGMLELLEPWRGHRERVVRLIGGSGFRKPAFGPRITIQDHRGH